MTKVILLVDKLSNEIHKKESELAKGKGAIFNNRIARLHTHTQQTFWQRRIRSLLVGKGNQITDNQPQLVGGRLSGVAWWF